MIPMIVRVWCESGAGWSATHVPVTPQTTSRDVLECCREPGDEPCVLLSLHPNHGVHVLRDPELPLEVASALGPDVQFVLKYIDVGETGSTDKSNGMKEPGSPEELEILRQLIAQSARIIEDKSNKTSANFQKNKEWKNITIKFNEILGKSRTDTEMKLAWKRIKLSAKANVSNHRREQCQTGGGEKPPSPSPEDLAIMDIAPHDFMVEVNDFDSDAVIPNLASAIVSTQSDMDSTAPEPSIPGPSIGPIAGPGIEFTDQTVEEHLEPVTIEEQVVSSNKPGDKNRPARKKISNRTEEMRQSITSSNIDFKKQQIKMMQIEHSNNIKYKQRQQEIMEIEHSNNNKIAQLKIKKLELALLEHKKNTV